MMPALRMRMSRRGEEAVNWAAVARMEGREVRSHGRKVMAAVGTAVRIEVMAS